MAGWVDFAIFYPPDQRVAMGDTHPTPILTDLWMGGWMGAKIASSGGQICNFLHINHHEPLKIFP